MCPMLGRRRAASVYNRNHQGIEEDNLGEMGNRSQRETTPKSGITSAGAGTAAETNGKFSLISDEKLLALYKNLLKCRNANRQAWTSNGTFRAARDREAALVATAIDLGTGDVMCSREHGWFGEISDQAPIEKLLFASGLHGRSSAASGMTSTNGASRAADPLITQTAIGTALAYKTAKNGKVALVFSTEGSQEGLREAIEIASVHALPMVFVHHSDGKPNGRVPGAPITKKSSRYDVPYFPSITVDSHDIVAVYRVASEAMSRARQGRGPTLIECRPYRLDGHSRSNRNGPPVHDAIVNMEHYLRAKGLFDPSVKRKAGRD
jgi:TPP-dependent pyruvate/acetoin dehydrogenase alpha subunit